MTRDEVLRRLRGHRATPVAPGDAVPSAVLVALREAAEDLEVILTRRPAALSAHAGQVSFPGGRIEPGDRHPEAAALRETHEELGIPPDRVEVVARLGELVTVTGYHVTQVVGLVAPDVTFRPDPVEVARVFTVPLEALLDRQRWHIHVVEHEGRAHRLWRFPWDGEEVWGATAWMLRGLVAVLDPEREHPPEGGVVSP